MSAQESADIVGRGNIEGAELFRDWFRELNEAAERGRGAAYVFVMGSMAEILKVFDLPLVLPEITSLQTAVRRVADEYLTEAENYGYSPDICGYVKADIGLHLRGGQHPMGRIPKPAMAVLTNACNTYVKWAEIWQRMYGVPVFVLDVPATRRAGAQSWPGSEDFARDCGYVEAQIRELIPFCEKITGVKFDIDRLRETMTYANEMNAAWKRVLELNKSRPSLFNALTDGTVYLGVSNSFRGAKQGSRFFQDLVQEMEYKAAHGIGTQTEEKYRLAFVGVPCYPIFRRFNEMFTQWGGAFVHSTYLHFASGGANFGFQYDVKRPLESLAEGTLISVREAMDNMFYQDRILIDMVRDYALDGVVYHPIKSCRTVSTGLADSRQALMAATDIPSLFIESDMMDKRVISEAQMKNRADAFFEGLAARRQTARTV